MWTYRPVSLQKLAVTITATLVMYTIPFTTIRPTYTTRLINEQFHDSLKIRHAVLAQIGHIAYKHILKL